MYTHVRTYGRNITAKRSMHVPLLPSAGGGIKLRELSKYQFIKSKRQCYNLKRLPTKAKFTSNESRSVTKCKRPNCGLCIHLKEGNLITFKCGNNFKILENMPCEHKNVIYVMTCSSCGEDYIGETGNFLRKRVTVHNQQIRGPQTRMLKVSEHKDNFEKYVPQIYNFPV